MNGVFEPTGLLRATTEKAAASDSMLAVGLSAKRLSTIGQTDYSARPPGCPSFFGQKALQRQSSNVPARKNTRPAGLELLAAISSLSQ